MASGEPSDATPESGGISRRSAVIGAVAVVAACTAFGLGGGHGSARSVVQGQVAADQVAADQTAAVDPASSGGGDPLAAVALPSNFPPPADSGAPGQPVEGLGQQASMNTGDPGYAATPTGFPGGPPVRGLPDGPLPPNQLPGGPPMKVAPDPAMPRPATRKPTAGTPAGSVPGSTAALPADGVAPRDTGPLSRGIGALDSPDGSSADSDSDSDSDGDLGGADRDSTANGSDPAERRKPRGRGLGDGSLLGGGLGG